MDQKQWHNSIWQTKRVLSIKKFNESILQNKVTFFLQNYDYTQLHNHIDIGYGFIILPDILNWQTSISWGANKTFKVSKGNLKLMIRSFFLQIGTLSHGYRLIIGETFVTLSTFGWILLRIKERLTFKRSLNWRS